MYLDYLYTKKFTISSSWYHIIIIAGRYLYDTFVKLAALKKMNTCKKCKETGCNNLVDMKLRLRCLKFLLFRNMLLSKEWIWYLLNGSFILFNLLNTFNYALRDTKWYKLISIIYRMNNILFCLESADYISIMNHINFYLDKDIVLFL